MFLVTSSKQHRLLYLNYVQRVTVADLERARDELKTSVDELPADFRVLADLSLLESMEPECAAEIGRTMEMIDRHGVGLIVRVIPDGAKDIGLNILTIFHYAHRPRIINCSTLAEALHKLSLWA